MREMKDIRFFQRIKTKRPVLLAAWPGMGNVALGSIDYLRRVLGATPIIEIDMSEYTGPDAVVVNSGVANLPQLPRSIFYYTSRPEIVFFESEAQLGGGDGVVLMQKVLDLALELNIQRIYTAAAFPLAVSHREASTVFGVTNKPELRNWLTGFGVGLMEGGQISGLNGLLLGYAARRGIEGICLLATMPIYAVNLPNPKGSKSIIEVLCRMLGFKVDMTEIDRCISEMDQRMEMIEEKMREVFSGMEREEEPLKFAKTEIPKHIMQKIDQLFVEAREDKQKAYILKEELDRWDLYKDYEDRFLDLFKENQ